MDRKILVTLVSFVVVAMSICALAPIMDASEEDGYVTINVTYNKDWIDDSTSGSKDRIAQASTILTDKYSTLHQAQIAFWSLFQSEGAFHYTLGDTNNVCYDVIDSLEYKVHGTITVGGTNNTVMLGNNLNEYGFMINDIRLTGDTGARIHGDANISARISGGYDVRFVQDGTMTVSGIEFDGASVSINATGDVFTQIKYDSANTIVNIHDCVFHGRLYMYSNDRDDGDKIKNVYNNTFTAEGDASYAFFIQGQYSVLNFCNNLVEGYARGINIHEESPKSVEGNSNLDDNRSAVLISGNTFTNNTEPTKACIQLTNGYSAVVEYNVLKGIVSNAFKFHEAGKFVDTVTIRHNYIEAGYILNNKCSYEVKLESYDNFLDIDNPGMGINDTDGNVSEEGNINGISVSPEVTGWYSDNPDATSFRISTVDQLMYLSFLVMAGETFEGDVVTLENDVDLSDVSWMPIGNNGRTSPTGDLEGVRYFAGDFNGQEHTISGLSSERYGTGVVNDEWTFTFGLFGFVSGSKISNVSLTDVIIDLGENSDSVGGLIGYAIGDTSVENVQVTGSIAGGDAVGGIVGRAYATSITIADCINRADVTTKIASGKAGGIVSTISTPCNYFVANNCINEGAVFCENGSTGGIVGFLGSVTGAEYSILGGSNSGSVAGNYAGGAIGYDSTASKTLMICGSAGFNNAGEINAVNGAGGVIGIWQSNGSIINAMNSGNINGNCAGGIIGSLNGGNCSINESNVTSGTISGTYAGGIAASVGGNGLTIEDCEVQTSVIINGTNPFVTENQDSVYHGTVAGVAVGRIREADLTICGMSDYGSYELVSATYFNGGHYITLENCTTSNPMIWSSNSDTTNLTLINTDLAGIEFNRTTLNIVADSASKIKKLIAGVEGISNLLDQHGIEKDFSGHIVITSGTTLNVDEYKATVVNIDDSNHAWYAPTASIKGADTTSGLTVNGSETSTPYIWDGTDWVGALTVTFNLWGSNPIVNIKSGATLVSFPESDRGGFTIVGWMNGDDEWDSESVVTESIVLTPVWNFIEDGAVITSGTASSELDLEVEIPTYEGTIASYEWDGSSNGGSTITIGSAGTYRVKVTITSVDDTDLSIILEASITVYSVTFDDSVVQTVILLPSGESLYYDQFPGLSEREGFFTAYWDSDGVENISEDVTINAVWVSLLEVYVRFNGEIGNDMTATVTTSYIPPSGISLWYMMICDDTDDGDQPGEGNVFQIEKEGSYTFAVYAMNGDLTGEIVGIGTSESYYLVGGREPQELVHVSSDGDNGTAISKDGEMYVSSDGDYDNATLRIEFPSGTMTLSGSFSSGVHHMVLKPVDKGDIPDDYSYGFHVETPISAIAELKLSVTVDVPDGFALSGAMVYRQDDAGNITMIGDAKCSGNIVSFTTNKNSIYWISASFVSIEPTPGIPNPLPDEDEDIFIPTFPSTIPEEVSDRNDSTVAVVACAAAAVVAALMAIFLIIDRRS